MKVLKRFKMVLSVIALMTFTACPSSFAKQVALNAVISDPAVPTIALPAQFTSYRVNSDKRIPASGEATLAELNGPGCVRHIWLLPGEGTRLVIQVDNDPQPQVDIPLKPFFGVMNDRAPYPVDCAAYTVFPNPAPGVPGTPGYNLFLPIPFRDSCRIALYGPKEERAVAMIDWQAYDESSQLTPYRFYAEHRRFNPAPPRGEFIEMADIEGEGFLAGVVTGFIQLNHSDMVFHTNGMTILLDGETNPHVISGHNVEDDFGFTWGFNDIQTKWMGCPTHINRSRLDQDGVFYRFFGPDPIAFHSSLVFRTGCRGDDMETVVYYYRIPDSAAPEIESPLQWQLVGLFPNGNDWNVFQQSECIESLMGKDWPEKFQDGDRELSVAALSSERGWINLQNVFFEKHHTATPLAVIESSAYARTVLNSSRSRKKTLCLTVDDWTMVWLNGEKIATLNHEDGLRTARIPVTLRKGSNELLVKTNNTAAPPNHRLWVIHAMLEK